MGQSSKPVVIASNGAAFQSGTFQENTASNGAVRSCSHRCLSIKLLTLRREHFEESGLQVLREPRDRCHCSQSQGGTGADEGH